MALPTLFETVRPTMRGLSVSGVTGSLSIRLFSCTGLTSTYTRALSADFSALLHTAKWSYSRIGGAGPAVFEFKGGLQDLDTAVQNQHEMEFRCGTGTSPTVLYRGRIVRYEHYIPEKSNEVNTRVFVEGYVTKLKDILVTTTIAAGQTVKQAVTTLLDTYVTPNTRIRYHANDIVGAYTLVGALTFKSTPLLECFRRLSMLQGSTEWGITEGGDVNWTSSGAPAFYFKAESTTATSNDLQFPLKSTLKDARAQGSVRELFNTVKVLGAMVTNVMVTGTSTDATSASAYGALSRSVSFPEVNHATDANRIASNFVTAYKDGVARLQVNVANLESRLEPNRAESDYGTGTPTIPVFEKASFRGVDGAVFTEHITSIDYSLMEGCPHLMLAHVQAGAPEENTAAMVSDAHTLARTAVERLEQFAASGGSGDFDGLFSQTADATVANTTTETTIFGTGQGSLTVAANHLTAGKSVRIKLRGRWSTTTPAPTMNVRFKIGGTTYNATGVVALFQTVTDGLFEIDIVLTCRTAGSGGTCVSTVNAMFNGGAAGVRQMYDATPDTTTIDTTATNTLDVTVQWGTASAQNTITSLTATVDSVAV
jgi:hypothetical protein